MGDDLRGVPLPLLGVFAALPMLRRASSPSGRLGLCLTPVLRVTAAGSKTHMILVCLGPGAVETTSAMEREAVWGHRVLWMRLSACPSHTCCASPGATCCTTWPAIQQYCPRSNMKRLAHPAYELTMLTYIVRFTHMCTRACSKQQCSCHDTQKALLSMIQKTCLNKLQADLHACSTRPACQSQHDAVMHACNSMYVQLLPQPGLSQIINSMQLLNTDMNLRKACMQARGAVVFANSP